MSFLKVRSQEEIGTAEKEYEIAEGNVLEIQEAHIRLQEVMGSTDPVGPTSKLETQRTLKSPLELGNMTKAQATRKSKPTKSSPKSSSYGGDSGGEVARQKGLSGGLCRTFHPYISKEKRPTAASINIITPPVSPYKFEMDDVQIYSKDFAYLVKWCQNHNVASDIKVIRGVQANKLSFDRRGNRVVVPNRIFEATLLLSLFNGDSNRYDECRQLCKFLYSVDLWKFDTLVGYPDAAPSSIGNVRFSNDITAFQKLSPFCQSLFIGAQYFYTNEFDKVETGHSYWFRNGFDLQEIMTGGMASSTYCFNHRNLRDTFHVTINELSQMSLHGQITLMRHAVYLENNIIYVALDTKNEVGKLGRRYSSIVEISKLDRAFISNLKGYDMEAAMQAIFLYLVPNANIPFFQRYIKEKKIMRNEIATLMNWSIERTKEVIQAIIMGESDRKVYKDKLEKAYNMYTERDILVNFVLSKASDNTMVAKYSRKRTKDKHPTSQVNFKKMSAAEGRSFMFFYWTYYERKIQDAMVPLFTNPLPLHDAVYSQSDLPDMKDVEDEIKKRTGITMKLGAE